jgi:hypothetical protein
MTSILGQQMARPSALSSMFESFPALQAGLGKRVGLRPENQPAGITWLGASYQQYVLLKIYFLESKA